MQHIKNTQIEILEVKAIQDKNTLTEIKVD